MNPEDRASSSGFLQVATSGKGRSVTSGKRFPDLGKISLDHVRASSPFCSWLKIAGFSRLNVFVWNGRCEERSFHQVGKLM
jgi:hypothetical protein